MKKNILILFLFASLSALAQKSLNNYKYAIVPVKFAFTNEENEYRLNTITKFNLSKMGFEAFYDNENLPLETAGERCSRVFVNVEKVSSLLSTKLIVVFRDCENREITRSDVGTSKAKEYKLAYPEALNNAFKSLFALGYNYNGTVYKAETKKVETPKSSVEPEDTPNMLFAQPISNGYQLIDKTPKVVFKIFKTSHPDYFTVQSETINGALIRKNNEWILEYYKDDKPVSEKLLIKF
ncbi:hypothetical protein [Flavobacterium microcysteis]|uniref:Uncharacterized protein n=1 Tax=Flavobacterium microcysteis TaxID=2596891 RepID=A0A501QC06_9FLAO|nr:hypothetical protein [Flavobacterium microcysteis]TPD69902.1 hypothetical protein FJA49_08320 [Flavobacterium microcysteis]